MEVQNIKGLVTTGRNNDNDFELLISTNEDKYPTKSTHYTSAVFEGDVVIHYNNGKISSVEIKSLIPKQSEK